MRFEDECDCAQPPNADEHHTAKQMAQAVAEEKDSLWLAFFEMIYTSRKHRKYLLSVIDRMKQAKEERKKVLASENQQGSLNDNKKRKANQKHLSKYGSSLNAIADIQLYR